MAYSDEVLADSPVGYWRLGETSGTTAADASGNARNGTYTSTYTLNQASLVPTDATNKSVLFGGGYVNIPFNAAFDFTTQFSLELSFKTNGTGNYRLIRHANTYGYDITMAGGQIGLHLYGAGGDTTLAYTSAAALNDNAAHHLIITRASDGSLKFFVDGVLVISSSTSVAPVAEGTQPLRIGAITSASQAFLGVIDEVAIYNTALSDVRALAHYNAWSTGVSIHEMSLNAGTVTVLDSITQVVVGGMNVSPAINAQSTMSNMLRFAMSLNATAELADTMAVNQVLGMTITDSVEMSDALASSRFLAMALSATAAAHPNLAMNGILSMVLADTIKASVIIQAGDVEYNGWIINSVLGASAGIEGMQFNSFATHKGRSYGIGPGGVYALGGDSDDGAPIDAFIGLPRTNFGTTSKKRVPHAYIGMSGEKMVLRVVTDAETYTYTADNATPDMGEQRVTIGKGLRANYWQFELVNEAGANFDIDNIKFLPIVLERRRGE